MGSRAGPGAPSVAGGVRPDHALAALGSQTSRVDQRGPGVADPRLRRGDLVLARPRHDQEPPDSRERPERPVDHPAGRRPRRLLRPRARHENLSRGAPSGKRSVLLPPRQAGARGVEDGGRFRAAGGAGFRRSAAAVGGGSRSRKRRAIPGASTSARSPSTTSTRSGSTHFAIAESRGSREGSFCGRVCSRASVPRGSTSRAARRASGTRPWGSPMSGTVSAAFEPFEPPPGAGERGLARVLGRSEARVAASSGSSPSSTSFALPPAPASKTAWGRRRSSLPSRVASRRARSGLRFRTDRCG